MKVYCLYKSKEDIVDNKIVMESDYAYMHKESALLRRAFLERHQGYKVEVVAFELKDFEHKYVQ